MAGEVSRICKRLFVALDSVGIDCFRSSGLSWRAANAMKIMK